MILDIYIEETLVLLMIHINPNDQQIVLPSFHLQNKYYTLYYSAYIKWPCTLEHSPFYIGLLKVSQLSQWQKYKIQMLHCCYSRKRCGGEM